MYVLTRKEDDVVMHVSETLNRQEVNNYYLINNNTLAIPPEFCKDVYEVEEVPEEVIGTPEKYCYTTEQGFYKNENWKPYYSEQERIEMLEDMVNMLILGGE